MVVKEIIADSNQQSVVRGQFNQQLRARGFSQHSDTHCSLLTNPRRIFFTAILVLSFLLSACTGTQEVGVPRLLIIGSGNPAGKLSMVQDVFFSDRSNNKRFQLLKELTLPGTPIAYDVTDRLGLRKTLVVLSQSPTDTYLNFVNLANINPESPDAFDFITPENLVVNTLTGVEETFEFAPSSVQINDTGRYVTIMNSFNDARKQDSIDIIDLEATGGPELLGRFTDSVIGTDFFLDQANSRLFFFTTQSAGAELTSLSIPGQNEINTGIFLPNSNLEPPLDLELINGELIALQKESFTPILNPVGTPDLGTTVTTSPGSQELIPTNSNTLSNVLILSSSQLTVHRSTTDTEIDAASFSVLSGSVEPSGGFAYFIANGSSSIRLFDVQQFNGDPEDTTSQNTSSFQIFESAESDETVSFENTVFVTWAISSPPAIIP